LCVPNLPTMFLIMRMVSIGMEKLVNQQPNLFMLQVRKLYEFVCFDAFFRKDSFVFRFAAVFLEILEQFEDPEAEEHKQKRLYAKWKATEILKAIKEGRDIVPGGYGEQVETDAAKLNGNETEDSVPTASLHREDLNEDEGTEVEINGTISPPSYNETQDEQNDLPPPISAIPLPPPPTIAPVAAPTEAPKTMANLWGFTTSSKNVKLSKEHFEDAKELTKFALAALEAKDSELAANRLKQALQAIGY